MRSAVETPRLCGLDRFVTALFQEDVSGQLPILAQELSWDERVVVPVRPSQTWK